MACTAIRGASGIGASSGTGCPRVGGFIGNGAMGGGIGAGFGGTIAGGGGMAMATGGGVATGGPVGGEIGGGSGVAGLSLIHI